MYGTAGTAGVTVGAGGLAYTGFGVAWYVIAASILLVSGMLLLRFGRRRAEAR